MIRFDLSKVPKINYIERQRKKKKEKVCGDIICFDIETSSYFFDKQNHVYTYTDIEKMFANIKDEREKYEAINEKLSTLEKGGCCYLWQLGINNSRFYGRNLHEFKSCFDSLCDFIEKPFITFIHNAAFEFQWLRGIFDFDEIEAFYTESRKPLYFKYKNCEFRCTYRLTNSSLAAWGKKIGLEKLDTLDYHELYTPLSDLPDGALDYSERDIEIMYVGLQQYVKEYGNIWNIPYTQTGEVRRDLKAIYKKNINYHHRVTDMLPRNADEYKTEKWAYMGGLCFAGIKNAGRILTHVGSFDRTSAYPFQMVTKSFPASRFRECLTTDFDFELYHYIFYIELSNVKAKSAIHCIPLSRMINKCGSGDYDNGKLICFNGSFHMLITEQDFKTYQLYYEFDYYISKAWVSLSRLLDINLVKYILDLYVDKTSLKNIESRKDEYNRKKERINCIYGCAASSIVYDTHELLSTGEWVDRPPTDEELTKELQKKQSNMWVNTLPYSWGIYITSYQRADLLAALSGLPDDDFCYSDTDCLKILKPEKYIKYFNKINDSIIERIYKIAEHRKLDVNLYKPKDIDGNEHMIGVWENEGIYERAIFLGSKRYCYEQYNKKKELETHVVVSGVPKIASKGFKIENFIDGHIFTPWECQYKKNILTYIDGKNTPVKLKRGCKDEWVVNDSYAINMFPTGYDMSLTKDYSNLIELYKYQEGVPI